MTGVEHVCQNDMICAQCGENHFSLASICPVVKQYKEDLKTAVESALAAGQIRRAEVAVVPQPFQGQIDDFPKLVPVQGNVRQAWMAHVAAPAPDAKHLNLQKEISDLVVTIKALSDTMNRIENNYNESNKRVEVLDKRSMMHNGSLKAIIDTVQVISRWVQASNGEKSKLKKNINKKMEDLLKWQHQLSIEKNDIPEPYTSSSFQPATSDNNDIINKNQEDEVGIDEDLSMNSMENNA